MKSEFQTSKRSESDVEPTPFYYFPCSTCPYDAVRKALKLRPDDPLPTSAYHPSVEAAKGLFHRRRECALEDLERSLRRSILAVHGEHQRRESSPLAASLVTTTDSRLRVVPLSALKAAMTHKVARDAVSAAFIALARGDVVNPSPMSLATTAASSASPSASTSTAAAITGPTSSLQTCEEGEVHIKAAWIRGSPTYTVKVAAGYYSNPALYNLPSGSGAVLAGAEWWYPTQFSKLKEPGIITYLDDLNHSD